MTCQRLDDFKRLAVAEKVHNKGVTKRVRGHRHREVHPVSARARQRCLQPVAHGFVGGRPQWLTAPRALGGHPALDEAHVGGIGKRDQTHRVLRRSPSPASDLFRENAHERPRAVSDKGLRGKAARFTDARAGIPERAEQEMVSPIGHVVQQRRHLRSQQVGGGDAAGGSQAAERHCGGKIDARRNAECTDAFW